MIPLNELMPFRADREALSPNHNERTGKVLRGIVLHATADGGSEAGSLAWLQNPSSKVSAHLLFHRDGTVTRLVPDARRAWHAGVSEWRGIRDVNGCCLGWEIANRNDGRERYTDAQYRMLCLAAAHYCRQGLTVEDVVGHAEISPGRKTDPLGFDWSRFVSGVVALLAAPALDRRARPPNLARVPPPDHLDDLILEPITVPTRAHVLRAAERAGVIEEILCQAAPVVELVLRGVVAGNEGLRKAIAAEFLAAFGGFREGPCG